MRLSRFSIATENPDNYVTFSCFHYRLIILVKVSGGPSKDLCMPHLANKIVISILKEQKVPFVCELKSKKVESDR